MMGFTLVKRIVKNLFPGVGWQHPIINTAYKIIDPFDWLVRKASGRGYLPCYSMRVRSNGINKQLGGRRFQVHGKLVRRLLIDHAGLNSSSEVLEIGCGCGRNAIALAEYIDNGSYTGVDIEWASLESCLKTPILKKKNFLFEMINVYNAEYNPSGKYMAKEYRFPYEDGSFDIIFLISVFTHMRPLDIEHYLEEIARMLKKDGTCMASVFLMDKGPVGNGISFPYKEGDFYFYDQKMPEVAMGYDFDYFRRIAEEKGLNIDPQLLWGMWRTKSSNDDEVFPQDVIFFQKN